MLHPELASCCARPCATPVGSHSISVVSLAPAKKPACQSQAMPAVPGAAPVATCTAHGAHPHTRFTLTWGCQPQAPALMPVRCDPSSWPEPGGCCRACRTKHAGPPAPGVAGCAPVGWVKEARKHRFISAGKCSTGTRVLQPQAPLVVHLWGGAFKQARKHRVARADSCCATQVTPPSSSRQPRPAPPLPSPSLSHHHSQSTAGSQMHTAASAPPPPASRSTN